MSRVRAITFDAGGTLIEPWPSVGAVYAAVAREQGLECCPDRLNRQFFESWTGRSGFGYSKPEWHDVVRQSFEGMAEVSPTLFENIYERFAEREAWLIYDDVIPALTQAEAAGLKLAVISNWDERLPPLLDKLGLATYFDQIVVSTAAGAHKPDSRIFQIAASLLEIAPDAVLHIGDSAREDVEGARRAGMRALRIRRNGKDKPDDVLSLTEALRLLGRDCTD